MALGEGGHRADPGRQLAARRHQRVCGRYELHQCRPSARAPFHPVRAIFFSFSSDSTHESHCDRYVPPILLSWSWLTYQNSMSRLLNCLSRLGGPCARCKQYNFDEEEAGQTSEILNEGRYLLGAERRIRVRQIGQAARGSSLVGTSSADGSGGGGGGASSPAGGSDGMGGGSEQNALLAGAGAASDDPAGGGGSDEGDSSEELLPDLEATPAREHKWHKRLEARRAEANRTASIERPLTDPAPSP